MRRRGLVGSFWPTRKQELLLRAAIAQKDEDARRAWRELQPLDVEALESGAFPVLPLLYRRLRDIEPDDPRLARLRGTYRKTWYRNQLQLARIAGEVAAARESDDRPLVVGDAARASYYPELGLRPILETGVLLGPEHAPGYLFPSNRTEVAEEVWRRARDVRVGDSVLPVPEPADLLVFVVGAGARRTRPAGVQWLVDVHAIVVSGPAVDHELIEVLAATALLSPARDAFDYLARVTGHERVAALRDRLASEAPTRRDRVAHRLAGSVSPTLGHYLRTTAAQPLPRAVLGLPGFLQQTWELERPSDVPVAALKRGLARLRL